MKHWKLQRKQVRYNVFQPLMIFFHFFIGSDAYETTLEYGADGVKKARKIRKSMFLFDEMCHFYLGFLAEQTLELTRDAGSFISFFQNISSYFFLHNFSQRCFESKPTCRYVPLNIYLIFIVNYLQVKMHSNLEKNMFTNPENKQTKKQKKLPKKPVKQLPKPNETLNFKLHLHSDTFFSSRLTYI